jgi:hypothetical protein
MLDGVLYIAYGTRAVREAAESIRTLRKHHGWPVTVIGDKVENTGHIDCDNEGMPGRWAKVNLLDLSPFERTLYLDADTRIHGKLDAGFRILDDGWDLVMVPSQIGDCPLHHLDEGEREITLAELGDTFPLMLNTGVMWFRKSPAMQHLFAEWATEWQRFKKHDQGALLRALEKNPVKLWLLGPPFNGGDIIEHLFGRAR